MDKIDWFKSHAAKYTVYNCADNKFKRTKQKLPWPGTAVSVFCRLLSRFQAKFGMILFLQQLLGLNFGTRASPSLPSHGKGAWVQTAWIPCGIRGCWSGCLISTIKGFGFVLKQLRNGKSYAEYVVCSCIYSVYRCRSFLYVSFWALMWEGFLGYNKQDKLSKYSVFFHLSFCGNHRRMTDRLYDLWQNMTV